MSAGHTIADLKAWARQAKASGKIIDWDTTDDGAAITALTDQGWCPAMYGSDTEPEHVNGCDPREDYCEPAGSWAWRAS